MSAAESQGDLPASPRSNWVPPDPNELQAIDLEWERRRWREHWEPPGTDPSDGERSDG